MRQDTRQEIATTLAELLNHILRSPTSEIGTEELARRCGYSRSHLTRIFREMCGESLGLLHRRIRLERSAYSLLQGIPVRESGERGGFDSPEAFARAFRRAYAVSPREFAAAGLDWKLPSPDGLHWNEHWDESLAISTLRVKYETTIERSAPFRVAAIRHVGNYGRLCDGWEKVRYLDGKKWVTIYRDNAWTCPDKHLMRADLGYLLEDREPPAEDFELLEFPAMLAVKTQRYVERKERNEAWSYLSGEWPNSVVSWDEYEDWPLPFENVRTRACLGFGTN